MRWDTTLKKQPVDAPSDGSSRGELGCGPTIWHLSSPGMKPGPPQRFVLETARTRLGRAMQSPDVGFPTDPHISREHAHLVMEGGDALLVDRSTSGTAVNGRPIAEQTLTDGDIVRIGDTFLLFRNQCDLGQDTDCEDVLGSSDRMRLLRRNLRLVGASQATVLLLGESGTGKEVAARELHRASGRTGSWLAVNCAAIAETLAESHLFGHISGAFSGAKSSAPGVFRAADGGTLLLDELGELPLSLQAKLLRALEERTVVPVGATKAIAFDTRIIAATNRDLIRGVREGTFRGDLYARLTEFTLELPPLRERREDIIELLVHFLQISQVALDPELVESLLLHDWPFNIRELRKVATHLLILTDGDPNLKAPMFAEHRSRMRGLTEPFEQQSSTTASPTVPRPPPVERQASAKAETPPLDIVPDQETLRELMVRHRGVVAHVARGSGRSRRQIYRWLEQHDLKVGDFRTG